MSDRGVFAVDRGIWDDPDFADETFSEREAFMWLIGQAAWRPTRVRIGSRQVDLARGQCAFSTRFLAQRWQWSEARVRRFLGRLISAEILCTQTDKIATHITILKYDRFQRVSLPDTEVPTHTRRTDDAPATHPRRKEEDREYTSLREGERVRERKHSWPDDFREHVWRVYGKAVEKKAGMAALEAIWRADRTDYTEFIAGIERQAVAVPDPQFRPSLERFIKREKWNDLYPEKPKEDGNGSTPAGRPAGRTAGGRSHEPRYDPVFAALADRKTRRAERMGEQDHDAGRFAPPHDPDIQDAVFFDAPSPFDADRRSGSVGEAGTGGGSRGQDRGDGTVLFGNWPHAQRRVG